jgi:hypothetical protein
MKRIVLLLAAFAVGCGGIPFVLGADTSGNDGGQGDGPDVVSGDGGIPQGDLLPDTAFPDAPIDGARPTQDQDAEAGAPDAALEADVVVDAEVDGSETLPDAKFDSTPDATPDAAPPDAAPDAPVCVPVAPATFGCGPPIIVNLPSQYCVLNTTPNTAQALSMPAACACDYTCECLVTSTAASGARLCPGGETYQSCSVGTTGGVVVVCR